MKKTVVILSLLLIILSFSAPVIAEEYDQSAGETAAVSFDDADESSPFYDDCGYVVDKGIMDLIEVGKFGPTEICTRETLAVALYRMAGSPAAGKDAGFSDVYDEGLKNAVSWGAEKGLIKGVGEDRFAPEGKLSREQFVTFLSRYARSKGADLSKSEKTLPSFTDAADISDWAVDGFIWAADSGIVFGTEDNRADPKAEVSRMQAAAIISRYLKSAPMSYADFKALEPEEQIKVFAGMSGKEIYYLVKESDENWPVTSYDLISPDNAKETIVLYDNNGLHFNLAWPRYGGFTPESIGSIGELKGTLDVSRDGGDGGCSLSYGKNEDGSYPDDSQRSVPKTSATVRTGTFNVDEYIKVVNVINESEDENTVLNALIAMGYEEETAKRFVSDYEKWFTRDEVSGPDNISDGAKLAGLEVEQKYGYYGTTAPWSAGDLDLKGGGCQLNTVFSWGTLCASGIIYDTGTADIK